MKDTAQASKPVTSDAMDSRIRIEDLSSSGVELSNDELRAISGAKFCGSWTSGGCGGTDEWVRC